jgi:hypothetical protein
MDDRGILVSFLDGIKTLRPALRPAQSRIITLRPALRPAQSRIQRIKEAHSLWTEAVGA